jgi:nucleoredoxin
MEELLGTTLKSKTGDADGTSLKAAQVVCLYFTASWSPPCRRFTPILAEFYKEVNSLKAGLEIVFVSCCKNEEEFTKYYEEMGWLALPWSEMTKINALKAQYKVQQIPTLVVLDPECKVVSENGRAEVMKDGEKAFLNWGGTETDAVTK